MYAAQVGGAVAFEPVDGGDFPERPIAGQHLGEEIACQFEQVLRAGAG